MKKRNISVRAFAAILAATTLLAGCGGSGSSSNYKSASYDTAAYATEEAVESESSYYDADYGYEENALSVDSNTTAAPEVKEGSASNRKLIKTVNMSVETKEFDNLVAGIEEQVNGTGGYIESSNISNYNYYSDRDAVRYASYTVRIPADRLNAFLERVKGFSNVVSMNQNVRDVTLDYVDLDSHKKSLLTEQDRLLELMTNAEDMEDILTIEERLSEIRYQVGSMESQLRTYDNQVTYSTVYIDITEVKELTVVDPETDGQRMSRKFKENVYAIGRGFKNFGINFVIALPYIITWAVIFFVIFLVVRAIIRKNKKKHAARQAVSQAAANFDSNTGAPLNKDGQQEEQK